MSEGFYVSVSRESARKAAINADQVEADAIRQGNSPLAGCLTDDTIAYDRLPEEYDAATNPNGNPEWAEDDNARETAVGETITEVERRIELLGQRYPFDLSPNKSLLTHKPERALSGVYEFCLSFSVTLQDLSANPACQAVREFERLVGRLLKSFLHGEHTEFYRSGAPADGDRPTTMTAMLIDLNAKTNGEWQFSPPVGSAAQAEQGDDAIDVVVWKPFGNLDRRIGKLFLLTQCACGDDSYWFGKRKELSPEGFQKTWAGTISFGGVLRSLATPRHVPHDAIWREGTSDGGILLDRVRLTWMGETCLDQDEQLICKKRLDGYTNKLMQKPQVRVTLGGVQPAKGKPKRRKR